MSVKTKHIEQQSTGFFHMLGSLWSMLGKTVTTVERGVNSVDIAAQVGENEAKRMRRENLGISTGMTDEDFAKRMNELNRERLIDGTLELMSAKQDTIEVFDWDSFAVAEVQDARA